MPRKEIRTGPETDRNQAFARREQLCLSKSAWKFSGERKQKIISTAHRTAIVALGTNLALARARRRTLRTALPRCNRNPASASVSTLAAPHFPVRNLPLTQWKFSLKCLKSPLRLIVREGVRRNGREPESSVAPVARLRARYWPLGRFARSLK